MIVEQNQRNLSALTREETIDILERSQEATVLRYIRQISQLNDKWPSEDLWMVDGLTVDDRQKPRNFTSLNNLQIAQIMEAEQKTMEQRLRRHMAVLQTRGDACVELEGPSR